MDSPKIPPMDIPMPTHPTRITPWTNNIQTTHEPDSMSIHSNRSRSRSRDPTRSRQNSDDDKSIFHGRRNGLVRHGRTSSSSSLRLDDKPLPAIPRGQQPISRKSTYDLSAVEILAKVIGPDNVVHTTELDAIPCAGIRIPNGPFSGLLAWRFVVRLTSQDKDLYQRTPASRGRQDTIKSTFYDSNRPPPRRRSTDATNLYEPLRAPARGRIFEGYHHERTMSQVDVATIASSPLASAGPHGGQFRTHGSSSSVHLPIAPHTAIPGSGFGSTSSESHGPTSGLAMYSSTVVPATPQGVPDAVVTNFILDTSSSHNTISRETLMALGANEFVIEQLERFESSSHEETSNSTLFAGAPSKVKHISLFLQNIPKAITFRLAPEGQPGRLGVQFFEESRVNVCIGEGGRGGIIWADPTPGADGFLREVPRTIPLPKATLQAKVLAFFGLDDS